ncbi:tripartite tricarboxylate transporter TctB family protein [Polynucleobacter sp. AP-Sanab-80-C2]|uniref:tripartite tricarboxylate transporter TctB family protein n=1 Tax=unclassified Polynucleobacter TaxID=2640945 RepID=UPI001BFD1300|nr:MULTISPECIES: tripartite tricarboxylate transporter TctB family protein [unclassified Polynucleobacter]MBU3633818.1 tripartite tricarboxylate transporter TctB family protein [Polynucleobacter sp. AP-Feld-500C-C5]MEA9598970.1 tripartite tricarboxylate transporter TctB family protein [Polynucleobacter sp. AP-Sanab-80-C2]QWE07262.1 tripartite tricarboxylate transporter TctB family protein [Polynucleobacter sp. JS-JIR-5-A7]
MSEHTNNTNQDSVISIRAMDVITSILFLAVGLTVMIGSLKLGASWGADGPEAGYFPFYISLIIMLSSTVTLYQAAIVNKKKKTETFVEKEPFKQVMAVLLPAIVFVLGVQLIGIYVSSAIYIAIFMVWLGKYPIWKAVAVSIGVSAALYLMFEFWFQVPLPHGSWINPLEFVGVQ